MRQFGLLLTLCVLPFASPAWAESTVVSQIGWDGGMVQARTAVNADARVLWATLTDYDQLARFVPGLTLSRQVSAPNAPVKLVEQQGERGMLSNLIPDHVIMAMDEHPYGRIGFRSVSAGITSTQGEWLIAGDRSPVQLTYHLKIVSLLPLPPGLADAYVEAEIRLRLDAVAREAERRMQSRK